MQPYFPTTVHISAVLGGLKVIRKGSRAETFIYDFLCILFIDLPAFWSIWDNCLECRLVDNGQKWPSRGFYLLFFFRLSHDGEIPIMQFIWRLLLRAQWQHCRLRWDPALKTGCSFHLWAALILLFCFAGQYDEVPKGRTDSTYPALQNHGQLTRAKGTGVCFCVFGRTKSPCKQAPDKIKGESHFFFLFWADR